MLNPAALQPRSSRPIGRRTLPAALGLALAAGLPLPQLVLPPPARAEMPPRPADLVVLVDRIGREGREVIAVFGVEPDPGQPGVRRVRLWEERRDRLTLSTDVVSCSPASPQRITGRQGPTGRQLFVRRLNPGGAITPSNRLDHLIWWAACVPEQAGRDPATLAPVARRLGYSGTIPESEEVLQVPSR